MFCSVQFVGCYVCVKGERPGEKYLSHVETLHLNIKDFNSTRYKLPPALVVFR